MKKTITVSLTIALILIFSFPVYASNFDPGTYEPPTLTGGDTIIKMVQPIINTISVIGIVVAVITLIVIGIKYITGSVSEKAEYKKTIIPYIVGVVMLVGITQILRIISDLVTSIE